ncbi:helix-turn-helix domain-containing protein [Rhizobium ruizarguesonis]|uniref:helix-turn-helix domain-containing protein n=1 Tax=Rhizobium ruizarguesonis TaxID=2081791 RepID=UPI00103081B1|nr:helix-turn-helix transcriptional regulator [Rhizobium ruizarguesonis]TBY56755.1 XRE family transcriptional regulator [Rhizobium leguminosarum bv. viciae]TAW57714.1 XRE family transcriptional regulator [Rhizobium ruizarguesonis]TBC79233.1 XRE family transcriptional regulator [Rhizobium ruizarguesonis]TBC84392.1 XRE family transcriptional regulator [Rhizobium ruizarguesonis]TBD48406.1 XRE family transcriptional regulator [Rhizobium ruizarguesonis]
MAKTLHSKMQEVLVTAIAEQRRAKGLSQAQVAKALGRHQPFIANIESGERRVDLLELLALADIIELDVHALIDRLRRTAG